MRYRRLGRTDLEVSAVSLGGAYLAGEDRQKGEENARAIVDRALDLGVNYIDTAPLYGESESLLGAALKGESRPFHLATKVGFKPEGFDYKRDSVLRSIERSLSLLGIEQLAVAQIHEVNLAGKERIFAADGTLAGLRSAQEQGLCRFVGITGRAIPLLAELAASGEFDTVLCYHDYHPCVQLAAEDVLPAAASQDMGAVMATVLAGGLYVDGPGQRQVLEKHFAGEQERRRAEDIVGRLRREESTLPQSAFRYVLADERVTSVSSGAANVGQLEEVAAAAEMEPLSL